MYVCVRVCLAYQSYLYTNSSPSNTCTHTHTHTWHQNSMYVFGGAKIPTEEITSELWVLDLVSLEWMDLSPVSNTTANDSSDGNETIPGVISMETLQLSPQEDYLPLPVRSHTAHVIGSAMVVLFGLTSDRLKLVGFVQEYDFGKPTRLSHLPTGGYTVLLRYINNQSHPYYNQDIAKSGTSFLASNPGLPHSFFLQP